MITKPEVSQPVAPASKRVPVVLWFTLGVLSALAVVTHDGLRQGGLRLLADLGSTHLLLYDYAADDRTSRSGWAEYLVVLDRDAGPDRYLTFFSTRPDIEYLSPSIYPHTVRIALEIPVGAAIAALEAQPFVRFVIKNYPFLFCH